jgi:hypothetical protein
MPRVILSLVLLAGCAAPQETRSTAPPSGAQPQSAEATGDESDCREEAVTGSMIKRTVCRTPEERERDRKNAQGLRKQSDLAPLKQSRPN